MVLGGAYGAMELDSAVSGKDWISGRELDTSERWVRGVLAPLDIIPGSGAAVTKFAGTGTTTLERFGGRMVPMGLKTGVTQGIQEGVTNVKDLADTASKLSKVRLRTAEATIKDGASKVVNATIDVATGAAKLADEVHTGMKEWPGTCSRSRNFSPMA